MAAGEHGLSDADLDRAVDAVLDATQALVGIALRSIEAPGPRVTLAQYRMLAVLEADGDQNVGDLAARLQVDRSTATRMCGRLANAGMIERRSDPVDGRAVLVSLTRTGRNAARRVAAARRREIASLLQHYPVRRRSQLVTLLNELAELSLPSRYM